MQLVKFATNENVEMHVS